MKIFNFFLILMTLSCSGKNKASLPQKSPQAPLVHKAEPKPRAQNSIRLSGQVVSQTKMLLAFQTPGLINKIIGKPGLSFKKGDVLAELDSNNTVLRAEAAQLRYEQALNAQKMAERDYRIEYNLRSKGVNSVIQFENAQFNSENARLSARMAGVEAKIASKAVEDARLRAPFDCVITQQFKSLGDSATGGQNGDGVFEIYETSAPEIRLQAPEGLLNAIKIGDSILIEIPALQTQFSAQIKRYVPIISEQTRSFLIFAHLDKPDPKVVPGYFAEGILK